MSSFIDQFERQRAIEEQITLRQKYANVDFYQKANLDDMDSRAATTIADMIRLNPAYEEKFSYDPKIAESVTENHPSGEYIKDINDKYQHINTDNRALYDLHLEAEGVKNNETIIHNPVNNSKTSNVPTSNLVPVSTHKNKTVLNPEKGYVTSTNQRKMIPNVINTLEAGSDPNFQMVGESYSGNLPVIYKGNPIYDVSDAVIVGDSNPSGMSKLLGGANSEAVESLGKFGKLKAAGMVAGAVALGGLALNAASNRGQLSNAQLYGQRPLY